MLQRKIHGNMIYQMRLDWKGPVTIIYAISRQNDAAVWMVTLAILYVVRRVSSVDLPTKVGKVKRTRKHQ